MSLRKFLAPNLAVLIVLSVVWLAGVDRVYVDNDHQKNLSKYLQVQQRIVDNYVGETDINELYYNSLQGFVKALRDQSGDEDINIEGTPIDANLSDLSLKDFFTKYND